MPPAPDGPTRWPTQTRQYAEIVRDRFYANIRIVASACAKHEKAELVLSRHVDEAFTTLGRLGFNLRPWYKRPELEVSVGLALLGLAVNTQDIITGLFGHTDSIDAIVCGTMVGLIVAGIVTWIHGWIRGLAK
jgi:hypothetical protein